VSEAHDKGGGNRAPELPLPSLQPKPHVMGATEYGLILLQSMLWGSQFFFVGVVKAELQPWAMGVLRLLPALVVLFTVMAIFRVRLPGQIRDWWLFLPFAALNNAVPFYFLVLGQREVTGGIAAIFNATAPLFTLVLAHFFLNDERLSWRRVFGVLVGIAGIGVLTGLSGATGSYVAQAYLLAGASCYAMANVYARKFLIGHHAFAMATMQMLLALVISLAAFLAFELGPETKAPSMNAFIGVMAMGFLGSGFASLCHFTILKRAGATNAILVTIILPVTPIVLGFIFLGETIGIREIAGGMIIALALLIIDGRVLRWFRRDRGQSGDAR